VAKKYEVTLGSLLIDGQPCADPTVTIPSYGDLVIKCIDEAAGRYEIFTDDEELADNCLTFVLSCPSCTNDCPPIEVTKCFCDVDGDCGECEDCQGGVCESQCAPGEFCEADQCVECNSETPCPSGQVCKNGQCVCPSNRPFLIDGQCKECQGDTIENCRRCVNGEFKEIVCPGVCDPTTNQCVDCLISTDCLGVNECCKDRVCDCCEGFIRNAQGVCEAAPECQFEEDCPPGFTCSNGTCTPIECPPGKEYVVGAGCVEECDCNSAEPCSDITDKCVQGVSGGCGCVDCEGDCQSGCGEGCYCDGTECVGDVCANGSCPCDNGADCPPGYGCDNGVCVPCVTLNCTSNECSNVLGCECAGDVCVDVDNGGGGDCDSSNDCPPGFTCYGGECVACENFDCTDCDRPGCGCQGNACVGQNTPCTDTFELTKSDEDCSITATLSKAECCSCARVTVDVRGKTISETEDSVVLRFIAEARKGEVTTSVSALPLLDDTSNANIAENDAPTAGGVELSGLITYADYEIRQDAFGNNIRVFIGNNSEALQIQRVGFSSAGNTATREFADITMPKIGTETTEGDIVRIVRSASIDFNIDTSFGFPNNCTYRYLGPVGSYPIVNNQAYDSFLADYSNEVFRSLQSQDCRLPLFRWYKSDEGNFTDAPFRKLYIDSTTTTFVDTIDTRADGAESCKYYLVETDCSCADNPNDYIVLCNPSDIDFDVTRCNLDFTLNAFDTCDVNEDVNFVINAGSLNIVFNKNSAPVGQTFTSATQIFDVEFGIECDVEGACTKTYTVQPEFGNTDGLTVNLEPQCSNTGQEAAIFIPPNDTTGRCSVVDIAILGETYFPNSTINLAPGTYNVTASWSCGCAPTSQTLIIDCCSSVDAPSVSRDCQGVSGCVELPGVTYFDGNTEIPTNGLCQYLNDLPLTEGATITMVFDAGCENQSFSIPPVQDGCCEAFAIQTVSSDSIGTITVYGDPNAVVTVSAGNVNNIQPNITNNGDNTYTVSPLVLGNFYTVTATSSLGCGVEEGILTAGDSPAGCDLDVTLNVVSGGSNSCLLEARTDSSVCPCEPGEFSVVLSNARALDSETMTVDYSIDVGDFEADVVDSLIRITDQSGSQPQASFSLDSNGRAVGTFTVDRVYSFSNPQPTFGLVSFSSSIRPNSSTISVTVTSLEERDQITSIDVTPTGGATESRINPFSSPIILTVPQTTDTVDVTIVFNIQGGTTQTNVFQVDLTETAQIFEQIELQLPKTVEQFATIAVSLEQLELEDNCAYENESGTFRFKSNGEFFSGISTLTRPLTALAASDRFKFFSWRRDGVPVFSEYGRSLSVLPEAFLTQGSDYEVDVACDPCSASDSTALCCEITIDASGNACGEKVDVTISAIPGLYTLNLQGVESRVVDVPVGGTITETFESVPTGSYNGYIEPQGIPSCRESFSVTSFPAPTALVSFGVGSFTLESFTAGTSDTGVTYCLATDAGNVTSFTSGSAPVGQTYSNPTDGVVRLLINCGTPTECEISFEPSPASCAGINVSPTIDYSGTAGSVVFGTGTGNINCTVQSVRVFGPGVDQVISTNTPLQLVANTYNYEAFLSCSCANATGTFTIVAGQTPALASQNTFEEESQAAGCGTQVTLEGASASGSPIFLGTVSNLNCDCNGDEFTASISGINDIGDNLAVTFQFSLNDDAEIAPTNGIFEVVGGNTRNLLISDGGRQIDFPKQFTTTPGDDMEFVISFIQTWDSGPGDTDVTFLSFEEDGSPTPGRKMFDLGVTGGQVTISDGVTPVVLTGLLESPAPDELSLTFIRDAALPPAVNSLYSFGVGTTDLTIDYVIDYPGGQFTGTRSIARYQGPASGLSAEIPVNAATPASQTEINQTLRINLTGLSSLSGCQYNPFVVGDFEVNSSGVVGLSSVTQPITATSAIVPRPKAVWTNDAVEVLSEYVTESGATTLPANIAEIGEEYVLTGSCDGCSESVTATLCVNVTGSVVTSVCLDSTTFTFNLPKDITYSVEFRTVTQTVSRPAQGTAQVTFVDQLAENTAYVVTVEPLNKPACRQTFTFTTGTKDGTCP
jgi:hypothetical protein